MSAVDDPHYECTQLELDGLADVATQREVERGYIVSCKAHDQAHDLVRMARHHDEEAERCARRGYPFNAWAAAVDAKAAWGGAAVYFLAWMLGDCPAEPKRVIQLMED